MMLDGGVVPVQMLFVLETATGPASPACWASFL